MNPLDEHTRRIGGLLLEVLVLVFVFSGACLDIELLRYKTELTMKTAPLEEMAFRDPNFSVNSFTECNGKVQSSHAHYTPFLITFQSRKVICASALSMSSYLYNIFYTHLTAHAP